MERRLVAILAADVVGYSRLMGTDEEATLATLNIYREVIDGLIETHNGRVFGSAGDSVVAEFASPVEAVRCAVEIQKDLETRNADLPEVRCMRLRIGVNLGDVMAESNNLFGDGVNVAARLEELAESGGICVSGAVHEQVKSKLDFAFEDLGERQLKNITNPVRVYRIAIGRRVSLPEGLRLAPDLELSFPEKPSIAVLPFINMSSAAEQEHFADGITEDIITQLSKLRGIFVISRSSTFVFKGRPVRIQEVARDLGVRHVLEGSVRRAANRVRITAQLVDGRTGAHLWAERYDRNVTDIFQVQDEITQAITVALQIQIAEGETARLFAEGTRDLAAWEAANLGLRIYGNYTKADNMRARKLFEEALQHDPDYLEAKVFLAFTYWLDKRFSYVPDTNRALEKAKELMQEIEAAGGRNAASEQLKAIIALIERRHDEALVAAQAAVELGPNDPWALLILGEIQLYYSEPRAALHSVRTAMRLSPYCPADFVYYLAYAHMWLNEHDKAIDAAEDYAKRSPNEPFAYPLLACVYGFAGREVEARIAIKTLRAKYPAFTVETYAPTQFYRDARQLGRLTGVLRQAGLPE